MNPASILVRVRRTLILKAQDCFKMTPNSKTNTLIPTKLNAVKPKQIYERVSLLWVPSGSKPLQPDQRAFPLWRRRWLEIENQPRWQSRLSNWVDSMRITLWILNKIPINTWQSTWKHKPGVWLSWNNLNRVTRKAVLMTFTSLCNQNGFHKQLSLRSETQIKKQIEGICLTK